MGERDQTAGFSAEWEVAAEAEMGEKAEGDGEKEKSRNIQGEQKGGRSQKTKEWGDEKAGPPLTLLIRNDQVTPGHCSRCKYKLVARGLNRDHDLIAPLPPMGMLPKS